MVTVLTSTVLFSSKRKIQKEYFQINNFCFTKREIDILSCLLSGRSAKAIGLILNLSSKTVETHVRNILQKTSAHSKEEIINLIEGSATYNAFKNHYLDTLMPFDKDKAINALSYHFKEKKILVKITGLNAQTKDLIQQFKTDYAHLGWEVRVHGISGEEKIEPVSKPYDDSLNLKIEKIDNKDNLYTIQIEIEKENKALDTKPEGSSYLPYEVAFLRGVQSICHKDDINNIINPFMQKHGRVTPQTKIFSPNNVSKISFFEIQKKYKYPVIIILCLLGLAVTGSYLAYSQVRGRISNLYLIPKEKLLLRQKEINKLNTTFRNHKDKETNPIVAIVGIGGAGKTTLARTYANRSDVSLVWELNARSPSALLQSFESLLDTLSVDYPDTAKEYKGIIQSSIKKGIPRKLFYLITKKLKKINNWTLVFDDVDDEFGEVLSYLPKDQNIFGKGKIIITTRNHNIDICVSPSNILELPELSEEDQFILFKKISTINNPQSFNLEETQKLLKNIPPFPLDVSIAAHYTLVNKVHSKDYLKSLRKSMKSANTIEKNILNMTGLYNKNRQEIINLSIEKIIQENPNFEDLLFLISLIKAQDIPRALLEVTYDKSTIDSFIFTLKKHSFITDISVKFNSEVFSIHQNFHEYLSNYFKNKISEKEYASNLKKLSTLFEKYLDAVKRDTPSNYDEFRLQKLVTFHAKPLIYFFFTTSNKTIENRVMEKLGQKIYTLGDLDTAKSLLLTLEKRLFQTKNYEILSNINKSLGSINLYKGNHEKSIRRLKEALKLWDKGKIQDPSQKIGILVFLGATYRSNGKYKDAEKYIKEAYVIASKHKIDRSIAYTRGYLGFLYNDWDKYEQAEKFLKQALYYYTKEKILINKAWAQHHLGYNKLFTENYKESLSYLEQAYVHFKNIYGEHYVNTAWIKGLIGLNHSYLGDIPKARKLLKENLVDFKNHFEEDTSEIAFVLQYMGIVELMDHQYEKAAQLFIKSLKIFKKLNHPKAEVSEKYLKSIERKKRGRK